VRAGALFNLGFEFRKFKAKPKSLTRFPHPVLRVARLSRCQKKKKKDKEKKR
jgi:hypothetical protein